MDAHVIADHAAIVDGRIVPDAEVIADLVFLPNHGAMTGFQVAADPGAGVDHRKSPDVGMRTDLERDVIDRASGQGADNSLRVDLIGIGQENARGSLHAEQSYFYFPPPLGKVRCFISLPLWRVGWGSGGGRCELE